MKTSGISDTVLPLSKKQKCACNIVSGCILLVAGLILTLAGVGVIKASVGRIVTPTVLYAVGLSVLISAIIAKNALSMWLAGVIIALGTPSLIDSITGVGYAKLYPIYIAAPSLGGLCAIWFAEAKLPQIKSILFFAITAGLFALAAGGVCGYGLSGGMVAVFIGLCVIALSLQSYFKKDSTENA